MNIEIKKSQKPVKYEDALRFMENRLLEIHQKKSNDLIWILEHEDLYTAGKNYKENEILDKSIKFIKTNRGGKITYHGPGQLIFYMVLDLRKRGNTNFGDLKYKTYTEEFDEIIKAEDLENSEFIITPDPEYASFSTINLSSCSSGLTTVFILRSYFLAKS